MGTIRTFVFGALIALATTALADDVKIAGVVSNIDHKTGKITVVTPLGESEEIAKVGGATVIDQDYNLVAIRGTYAKDAKIERDGKTVKAADIREGDFVRTSYDATADSFGDITAMSAAELKKQSKEESKEMKKDMKKDMKNMNDPDSH